MEEDCRGNGFVHGGCYKTNDWMYYTEGNLLRADSVKESSEYPGEPEICLVLNLTSGKLDDWLTR